ncbi:MAG TPA: PAS domain S-box protein [Blastocatellia bacterium]|nr:PAS domain S-box protein [Blastocatellia bacterium]
MANNKRQAAAPARNVEASALGTTEDHYRLLVESVKDYAIILLDTDGRVASWNQGAERIKGYQAKDIIGQHIARFYVPEDLQRGHPEHLLAVAAADGRVEDEGWRVRKDGSRFWADAIITALRDQGGTLRGYAKVTRDLTERKQMEERLERQAREILDIATPAVQVWEGVILAPLIGMLDSQRTQQLMERLLESIVETRSTVALVDITGVPTIDTQTARHLVETIAAVRMLGADVILTGVRPAIAQTLVHLGVDLSNVTTRSSLIAGLRSAMEMLKLEVTSKK